MSIGPTPITYTITGQEKTETLTPDGRFVDQWRISFETPSGVHSNIKILAAQYDPQVIDSMIRAEIANIEAVHQLGAAPMNPPAPSS